MKNKKSIVRLSSWILAILLTVAAASPASAAVVNPGGPIPTTPDIENTSVFQHSILPNPDDFQSTGSGTYLHQKGTQTKIPVGGNFIFWWNTIGTRVPEGAPNYENFLAKVVARGLVETETLSGPEEVVVPADAPSGGYVAMARCSSKSIELWQFSDLTHTTVDWHYYTRFSPVGGSSKFVYQLVT